MIKYDAVLRRASLRGILFSNAKSSIASVKIILAHIVIVSIVSIVSLDVIVSFPCHCFLLGCFIHGLFSVRRNNASAHRK